MAKNITGKSHSGVSKRTNQGERKPKTSSMSQTQKNSHKRYRGQGR